MGPPSSHKKNKSGGGATDEPWTTSTTQRAMEQPLQAVLLAEDWLLSSSSSTSSNGNTTEDSATAYQFHPLTTLQRPKILCPLLDRATLLDYALEFLAVQGVQQVYIVCSTKAVADYVESLQPPSSGAARRQQRKGVWSSLSSSLQLMVICDSTVTNAGDALRELDKRSVITADPFLLLHAADSTILAMDPTILQDARQQHQTRHAADSSAIVTLVLHQPPNTNNNNASLVVGLDPAHSNRVLVFEDTTSNNTTTSTRIPCSFLASHCPTLELHTTLQDTGVMLASPDVLARFSDEFDYRHVHREFITNAVAEEEEGLQLKVYAEILSHHSYPSTGRRHYYANRIATPRQYHAVARDLLRRYAHPVLLVPDEDDDDDDDDRVHGGSRGGGGSRLPNYNTHHHHHLHYYYPHPTAQVGRSTAATTSTNAATTTSLYVGAHTVVGEHVQWRGGGGDCTTLGRHCRVADHVVIVDSHLWDECVIESGAVIQQSILGRGVVVRAGAVIGRGCLIGDGCVIGTGVVLPPYTRLTTSSVNDLHPNHNDDEDDWESSSSSSDNSSSSSAAEVSPEASAFKKSDEIISDVAIVGPDGKGRVWKPPVDYDNDDDEDDGSSNDENAIPLEELLKSHCIGYDPTPLIMVRQRQLQEADDELDNFSLPEHEEDDTGVAAATAALDYESDDVLDDEPSVIIGRQEGVDVIKELKIICLEFEVGGPIENLAIELNSFKFSQNATYADCTTAATLALLEKMNLHPDTTTDARLVSEFKSLLDMWGPLLQKMSIGLDEEKAIVLALERCAVGEAGSDHDSAMSQVLSTGNAFRLLLQLLHDEEIVSEEAVLAWSADRKETDGDKDTARGRLLRLPPLQEFLEWLDEESDDEDSDDDDSGEEDI